MKPRLIAIDGPIKGRVILIDADGVSIGRDPSNRIALADSSVSRRHCRITCNADRSFVVADLESRNGTFINGVPAGERALIHGDRLRLGDCNFIFLIEDSQNGPDEPSVRLERNITETRTVVELRREDSVYMAHAPLPQTARVAQSLKVLLKISMAIRSADGVEPLAHDVLRLVMEATPARRGAILLIDKLGSEPSAAFSWDRASGGKTVVPVNSDLIERSFAEAIAILSREGDHSLLAAPLTSRERTIGILYLQADEPFDEEHLQVGAAVGSVAGLAIDSARRMELLETENRRLREEISIEHDMVGEGPRVQEVYRFISRVSHSEATVLILGESGTGKELVARAIHRNSRRARGPFVAVNCAALTESLLESEMFGHERGAFSGAVSMKKGRFELADGGTLFLDEIGELPASLQAKLLRALQEREFDRVGGTRSIKVDVRVIAATNADLAAAMEKGTFRSDLFFRLNVVSITIPPLRERREDIQLLASYFAARFSEHTKRKVSGISPEARACLVAYEWPGNVRELQNAIEHAVVLGTSEYILPEDLPESVLESAPAGAGESGRYQDSIKQEKRQVILNAVRESGGNYTEAAHILGVHPNYLHRLIRNLDLKAEIRKAIGR
jgi:two-component system, NtrC family, response regulator HydG